MKRRGEGKEHTEVRARETAGEETWRGKGIHRIKREQLVRRHGEGKEQIAVRGRERDGAETWRGKGTYRSESKGNSWRRDVERERNT